MASSVGSMRPLHHMRPMRGDDQACGGVDLPGLTVWGDGDLHADLSGGDEELVDGGVDPVAGRMTVGGKGPRQGCRSSSRGWSIRC
jgi:hypothetical protein